MKKILVEISWMGLINYSEDDIRLALVQKFKSTNFSVKGIEEEEEPSNATVLTIPDNLSPTSTTTYDKIH